MHPDQWTEINGYRVEEFYWAGQMVCYVGHRASEENYADTCRRLWNGEPPKLVAIVGPQPQEPSR